MQYIFALHLLFYRFIIEDLRIVTVGYINHIQIILKKNLYL